MRALLTLVAACLLAASVPARSQSAVRPDVLVNGITDELVAVLRGERSARRTNDLAHLVRTRIVPHFDFSRMTSAAMGRNWYRASPAQQRALTEEFSALLVRTYSQALLGYTDQEIGYLPLRMLPDETDVLVRSSVRRRGRETMTIDYDMERSPSGWKVIDLKLAGVSVVISYRESFAAAVRAGGVDGLVRQLAAKNKPAAM
jgi:phospholipid transport system substrate-binding protein